VATYTDHVTVPSSAEICRRRRRLLVISNALARLAASWQVGDRTLSSWLCAVNTPPHHAGPAVPAPAAAAATERLSSPVVSFYFG